MQRIPGEIEDASTQARDDAKAHADAQVNGLSRELHPLFKRPSADDARGPWGYQKYPGGTGGYEKLPLGPHGFSSHWLHASTQPKGCQRVGHTRPCHELGRFGPMARRPWTHGPLGGHWPIAVRRTYVFIMFLRSRCEKPRF